MRKIIEKTDGSKEILEGEPQEIRAYEDRLPYFKMPDIVTIPSIWPAHTAECAKMKPWMGIIPPPCTCGAEPQTNWTIITTTEVPSQS